MEFILGILCGLVVVVSCIFGLLVWSLSNIVDFIGCIILMF